MAAPRVLITGSGAICGAGTSPGQIYSEVAAGRSAIRPITQWDSARWPAKLAAEVRDYNAAALTGDRKLLKYIRRTDVFGLYAADRAIENAGFGPYRAMLDEAAAGRFNDSCGVYVASGGGAFLNQYDYFPLLEVAAGSLEAFGRELPATVNPMWLLRSLPNNVLGHVGIRQTLKGPNACITNHGVSGPLAIAEAAEALKAGECERAVAIGHDASIEPQMVLYYHAVGLLSEDGLRPFDETHNGTLMGEGAAALVLETEDAAGERGASVLGEVLGVGHGAEALGLLPIRDDGAGLARAIRAALAEACLQPDDVGMVVAHGNGTPNSDVSEARALLSVFGARMPPVTGFKWSIGHLLTASGIAEAVLAIEALRARSVPGIANLRSLDPLCAGLPVAATPREPRSDVALLLARGFGGTNAALLIRAAGA
ncbi:MAG: beta-ketoacyl synthase N-terminal-like domain-containing protein [Burkholderiaceae bacterium]